MSNSFTHVSKWTTAAALITLFGGTALAGGLIEVRPKPNPDEAQQLTRKAIKRLTAAAKSPEDHLTLASYYQTKADQLDVQGAGYEETAVALRNGPIMKNLIAPNTPARYQYIAKGFRENAKANHELAASHRQMARTAGSALE